MIRNRQGTAHPAFSSRFVGREESICRASTKEAIGESFSHGIGMMHHKGILESYGYNAAWAMNMARGYADQVGGGLFAWPSLCGWQRRVAALSDMVLPLVVGPDVDDIAAFNQKLQQRLHLHGRYGITMFAISAVDIALWHIVAKQEGVPLADIVGGRQRDRLTVYASLVRYGDPVLVRSSVAKAIGDGYDTVELHEMKRLRLYLVEAPLFP